jgi:hypothetical protein
MEIPGSAWACQSEPRERAPLARIPNLTLRVRLPPPVIGVRIVYECQIGWKHDVDHVSKGEESPNGRLHLFNNIKCSNDVEGKWRKAGVGNGAMLHKMHVSWMLTQYVQKYVVSEGVYVRNTMIADRIDKNRMRLCRNDMVTVYTLIQRWYHRWTQ